ncbi:MAG: hypothetical protein WCA85_03475 [Paraburkholderia sp.]|uniref:hypothetical protein n=1 Tax=Paraburkholderia sp. TaxID=1926495 RepID=UPI003C4DC515
MATESTTPLNLSRANMGLALRVLSFWHEARQQVCEFEMLRIKRDLAALHATREAAGADDWNTIAASCQTILRNYMEASASLWQQGLTAAIKQQTATNDGMGDALAKWQASWAEEWQKSSGMNATAMPLQEWMQGCEQAIRRVLDGRMAFGELTNSAEAPVVARRAPQGEQHVR